MSVERRRQKIFLDQEMTLLLWTAVTYVARLLAGWVLALVVVRLIPVQTIYPSEDNLDQVYVDKAGVCYRYERAECACGRFNRASKR